MKIAIDVRPLTSNITGIGRYTQNILSELINISPEHEWFLYAHRPLTIPLPKNSNVHIRTGNFSFNHISTVYAQFFFPFWSNKDQIDIFWSPRHHLPFFLSKKIKKVVTIHDIVWKRYPETMNSFGRLIESFLMPYSLRISDQIISVSKFTKSELINILGVPPEKINVTQLAPTPYKDHLPPLPDNMKDTRYLLFVGTIEPRKNLENLLIAFRTIIKEKSYKLVIVGNNGWGELKIKDKVKELGISKEVILFGYIEDDMLHTLYKNCEALLMPSLYEGFGLPALEALQYNKPVICTKKSAIPEIDSPFSILIDDESSKSIYEAIKKLEYPAHTRKENPIFNTWLDTAKLTKKIILK